MARYKPAKDFNTPMYLYVVDHIEVNMGVVKPVYKSEIIMFYGSFVTYGGTETEVNGVVVTEDTAVVETWYMPEFTAQSRIRLANDSTKQYEVIGEPENIERRNLYTKMKLRRVQGGA